MKLSAPLYIALPFRERRSRTLLRTAPVSGRVPDKQKQADISELDKGINPNPFPKENYGQGHYIGPLGVPNLHSGMSSTSS